MQINAASLAFPGTLWQALKGKHVRRWPGLSGPGFFLPLVSTRPAEEQCHVNTPLRFPDDPRDAGYIGNFRPSLKAGNFERETSPASQYLMGNHTPPVTFPG
jgi:hypothetical protein